MFLPVPVTIFQQYLLSQAVGYLVSQNGTIDFPMLGTLEVTGMTKEALKDSNCKKLRR